MDHALAVKDLKEGEFRPESEDEPVLITLEKEAHQLLLDDAGLNSVMKAFEKEVHREYRSLEASPPKTRVLVQRALETCSFLCPRSSLVCVCVSGEFTSFIHQNVCIL